MRVIVAPQEFKGTLTAHQATEAMADGTRQALPDAEVEEIPLADGGPGTVRAIVGGAGGELRTSRVHDALGRPVNADWAMLLDGTAVIEMAAAAGLSMIAAEERDPRRASTYGVGDLIRAALDAGARRLLVGLGGSATNDGGAGMAAALGMRFLDATGQGLPPGGGPLARLDHIDASGLDSRLGDLPVVAATDVGNPLLGPQGASIVYGPQKGATQAVAQELDAALAHYAQVIERDLGIAVAGLPGAGSAGGLGAGLIAFLYADVRPGFDVIAEVLGLEGRFRGADLVLTGEGRLDGQTGWGKTVIGVARMAHGLCIPVLIVPAALGAGWEQMLPYVSGVEPIVGFAATVADALARPAALLTETAARAIAGWRLMVEA